MTYKMDPHFETIIMLSLCPWGEDEKKEMIAKINQLGIDGQEFYSRNCRILEQYYSTFEKHKIPSPGAALLSSYDDTIVLLCISIFRRHPEWIDNVGLISDNAAKSLLEQAILPEGEDAGADIFEAIDNLAIEDHEKWQITLFRQKAGQLLVQIAAAVRDNLQAFEKAYSKYKHEIDALIIKFEQEFEGQSESGLLKLPQQLDTNADINITMALATAIIAVDGIWYCGLIACKLLGNGDALSKDDLILGAKAIGDKSKIEILLSLKAGSRYNLEIAEMVGLTPATVSHHMNALLISGFVTVEKREGRVYYKLACDGISRFLAGLRHLLLESD